MLQNSNEKLKTKAHSESSCACSFNHTKASLEQASSVAGEETVQGSRVCQFVPFCKHWDSAGCRNQDKDKRELVVNLHSVASALSTGGKYNGNNSF